MQTDRQTDRQTYIQTRQSDRQIETDWVDNGHRQTRKGRRKVAD